MKKTLSLLNIEEFPNVYHLMGLSFPDSEIRSYEGALLLFEKPNYEVLITRDHKGNIGGFIAQWHFEKYLFIEHTAVHPNSRNEGLGTRMLSEYLYHADKPVYIEVEREETQQAKRRVKFYQRLGFFSTPFGYVQPTYKNLYEKVHLNIMTYPYLIKTREFLDFKKEIFLEVYNQRTE